MTDQATRKRFILQHNFVLYIYIFRYSGEGESVIVITTFNIFSYGFILSGIQNALLVQAQYLRIKKTNYLKAKMVKFVKNL